MSKDGQDDEHHLISGFLLLLDTQKVQIERPLLSPENNYLVVLAPLTRICRDNEQMLKTAILAWALDRPPLLSCSFGTFAKLKIESCWCFLFW